MILVNILKLRRGGEKIMSSHPINRIPKFTSLLNLDYFISISRLYNTCLTGTNTIFNAEYLH